MRVKLYEQSPMKKELQPPKWIYKLIERFCDPYLWEGISGDLEEGFHENVELKGLQKARWIYLLNSIGFLRNIFKDKTKNISNMKSIWLNYFTTSYRSIQRNKLYFFINLAGLILAISCGLFALIYVTDEMQFDKFHTEGDKIHRLYKRHLNEADGVDRLTFEVSGMMGPSIVDEFPEAESFLRINFRNYQVILSNEKNNVATEQLYIVDSTFFDFFDFEIVAGNPNELLNAPSTIVLSESLARAIFGDSDPIGKTVLGLNDLTFNVTGVFKDPPRTSSIQCNALVSWSTTVSGIGPVGYNWMNNWRTQGISTFLKLSRTSSIIDLETKFKGLLEKHLPDRADQYFLKLKPFNEMYLYSDDIQAKGSMQFGSFTFVLTLAISAFLIFVIATVNYINSSLSRFSQAQTEVGIRKTMGSSKQQLMGRFMTETLISSVLATIIGVGILLLFLPKINAISGKELPTELLYSPLSLGSLIGFIILVCLIVGVYPAYVISSQPVSAILKSSSGQVGTTGWFRKMLLTLQYFISILLLISTVLINQQTQFLKNRPLGIDKEQVLVIDIDNEINQKVDVFEEQLLSHANILSVSSTRSAIGGGSYTDSAYPVGYSGEVSSRIYGVDADFFDTYGIETNTGRTFLKNSTADSTNLIVNQSWVDFVGWEDPIGRRIRLNDDGPSYPIIGVVNDFHIFSLATSTVEPMIMYLHRRTAYNASVRIGTGELRSTIDHISSVWDNLSDRTPLNFYFVDQWFDDQYRKENQLLKISTSYSFISIILCGLGLFSLTALLLQQRTREISIRRVLGATMGSILSLINKQFVVIIGVSFALATPIAYWLLNKWVDQFAYQIAINPLPFLISGLIVLLVSVTIVSFLSVKTANVNPSQNLRAE